MSIGITRSRPLSSVRGLKSHLPLIVSEKTIEFNVPVLLMVQGGSEQTELTVQASIEDKQIKGILTGPVGDIPSAGKKIR